MSDISKLKSCSDLDNNILFPVPGLSSQNVWISSDSDKESEDTINIYDPKSSKLQML